MGRRRRRRKKSNYGFGGYYTNPGAAARNQYLKDLYARVSWAEAAVYSQYSQPYSNYSNFSSQQDYHYTQNDCYRAEQDVWTQDIGFNW